ncbi:unnamed protein product [Prorocentrum cordatum]|uniref:Phospholipase B-like n=1 Tax=Prorocentrum cordatum TaxID=2364126 RepID=A0ABN9WQ56_9DINO|nr:unnamed protein product [Polarella glacialis]
MTPAMRCLVLQIALAATRALSLAGAGASGLEEIRPAQAWAVPGRRPDQLENDVVALIQISIGEVRRGRPRAGPAGVRAWGGRVACDRTTCEEPPAPLGGLSISIRMSALGYLPTTGALLLPEDKKVQELGGGPAGVHLRAAAVTRAVQSCILYWNSYFGHPIGHGGTDWLLIYMSSEADQSSLFIPIHLIVQGVGAGQTTKVLACGEGASELASLDHAGPHSVGMEPGRRWKLDLALDHGIAH